MTTRAQPAEDPEPSGQSSKDNAEADVLLGIQALLATRLRFAKPKAVAQLVLVQWRRHLRSLSARSEKASPAEFHPPGGQSLPDFMAGAGFVEDCDLVAEYRKSRSDPGRRQQIRWIFRERFSSRIHFQLEVLLEAGGVHQPGGALLDELAETVSDKVFGHPSRPNHSCYFDKAVAKYDPAQGATFEPFLKRRLLWVAKDAIAAHLGQPVQETIISEGAEDEEKPGLGVFDKWIQPDGVSPADAVSLQEAAGDRSAAARARLGELLARLGGGDLKSRKVALLFLYFKAYVEPDLIPGEVVGAVKGGAVKLRFDYQAIQRELAKVRERYAEAAEKVETTRVALARKHRELTTLYGRDDRRFLNLSIQALATTLELLRDGLAAEELKPAPNKAPEFGYKIAYKQRSLAQKSLEKATAEIEAYDQHHKRWLRKQGEIADLLGVPKGTIGRELSELRRELGHDGEEDENE